MTTTIHINDHDALNAAFAVQIAGWSCVTATNTHAGPEGRIEQRLLVNPQGWCVRPKFTRSMDAVIPWLEQWRWDANWHPKWKTYLVAVLPLEAHPKETVPYFGGRAPTLPHAAVVALLRAKGVTITEETHHD